MKIALLGGSFDPPHMGHYSLALQTKEQLHLDQVWLVPCFQHPFDKQLSPTKYRLEMTRLLENEWLKVSDYEIKKKEISYSIDTLRYFKKQYPHDSFSWIIGSDQGKDFPKWKEWEKIISDFGLIIFPRGNSPVLSKEDITNLLFLPMFPSTIHLLSTPIVATNTTSSTLIRQRIKEGEPITSLVAEKVERYIIEHKLYR